MHDAVVAVVSVVVLTRIVVPALLWTFLAACWLLKRALRTRERAWAASMAREASSTSSSSSAFYFGASPPPKPSSLAHVKAQARLGHDHDHDHEHDHATTTTPTSTKIGHATPTQLSTWRRMLHPGESPGWSWDGLDQVLTHMPVYLLAFWRLLSRRYPNMLARSAWSRLSRGSWIPDDVRDQDVYDLVVSSPLILTAVHNVQANTLTVTVPEHLPAQFCNGASPRGLVLVLDTTTHSIVSAKQLGAPFAPSLTAQKRGVTRNAALLSLLHLCLTAWLHPRTHVQAERSSREIAAKRESALEPSSRFVPSLHDGLVFGSLSPLRAPDACALSSMGDIASLFASFEAGPLPHNLALSKRDVSEYFDFLLTAHEQVRFWLRYHELGVSAEALFSNVVAHAVDHEEMFRVLNRVDWFSMDTSGTLRSYLASAMFTEMWIPHMHNPLDEERLFAFCRKRDAHPFYKSLYDALRVKNARLADLCTLSTSW